MDVLSNLSSVQTWKGIEDNTDFEKLRARLMASIVSEYRKFTEVANVRNHKNTAERRLQELRNKTVNRKSDSDSDHTSHSGNCSSHHDIEEVKRKKNIKKRKTNKMPLLKNTLKAKG